MELFVGKSKKDDKLTELGYTIEALEDEVEHWKGQYDLKQARIGELIDHNDRLTLTYEPFRPPGDDMENISYYDLNEENDSLTQGIMDKIHVIHEQDEVIKELERTIYELQRMIQVNSVPTPRKKYAGCLTLDFWPLSDWFRLKLYRWNPGKAFQLCIGPIRMEFFQS